MSLDTLLEAAKFVEWKSNENKTEIGTRGKFY